MAHPCAPATSEPRCHPAKHQGCYGNEDVTSFLSQDQHTLCQGLSVRCLLQLRFFENILIPQGDCIDLRCPGIRAKLHSPRGSPSALAPSLEVCYLMSGPSCLCHSSSVSHRMVPGLFSGTLHPGGGTPTGLCGLGLGYSSLHS